MSVREFLALNCNSEFLSVYLEGSDGFDWFDKKNIPEKIKNYKILRWKIDGNKEITIVVKGEIFADGF